MTLSNDLRSAVDHVFENTRRLSAGDVAALRDPIAAACANDLTRNLSHIDPRDRPVVAGALLGWHLIRYQIPVVPDAAISFYHAVFLYEQIDLDEGIEISGIDEVAVLATLVDGAWLNLAADPAFSAEQREALRDTLVRHLGRHAEEARPGGDQASVMTYAAALVWWHRFQEPWSELHQAFLFKSLELFEAVFDPETTVVPPDIRAYFARMSTREPSPRWLSSMPPFQATPPPAVLLSVLSERRRLRDAVLIDLDPFDAVVELTYALTLLALATHCVEDLDEAIDLALGQLSVAGSRVTRDDLSRRLSEALAARAMATHSAEDADLCLRIFTEGRVSPIGPADRSALPLVVAGVAESGAAPVMRRVDALLRLLQRTDSALDKDPPGEVAYLRSTLLLTLYRTTGEGAVLDEAVAQGERALARLRHDHESYWRKLGHLADTHYARYGLTATISDLQASIKLARDAIRDGGDDARAELTNNLVHRLQQRFKVIGDERANREAAELLIMFLRDNPPEDHAQLLMPVVIALSGGVIADEHLRETVDLLRYLIATVPPITGVTRSNMLGVLSQACDRLYGLESRDEDLRTAVMTARLARAEAESDADRAAASRALAGVLGKVGSPEAFAEAESALRSALDGNLDGDERARCVMILLWVESEREPRTVMTARWRRGLDEALASARDPGARGHLRRVLAHLVAYQAADFGDFRMSVEAFTILVTLLTDPMWESLPLEERRDAFGGALSAARDGAVVAGQAGSPELALNISYLGRGLALRDLGRRTDLIREAEAADPAAAKELRKVNRALQGVDDLDTAESFMDYTRAIAAVQMHFLREADFGDPMEVFGPDGEEFTSKMVDRMMRQATEHPRDLRLGLRAQWTRTVDSLAERGVLSRPAPSSILGQIRERLGRRILVDVTMSRYGAQALVVTGDDLDVVPLPRAGLERAFDLFLELTTATARLQGGEVTGDALRRMRVARSATQEWLWDAVAEPVLAHLSLLTADARTGSAAHVLWSLVSPVAALPMHLAGAPGDGLVLDRLVSSYVTTPAALRAERPNETTRPLTDARLLIIDGASAVEGLDLPAVASELAQIRWLMLGREETLVHTAPLEVLRRAPEFDLLHVACHASPSFTGALSARLFLDQGSMRVTDLTGAAFPHRPHLAYLSCCHAALDASKVLDDPWHLTAAFQAAGYRNVVGSLWAASDAVATRLAVSFYERLNRLAWTPHPVVEPVARALHEALVTIRELEGEAALWRVPFVHFAS